MKVKLYLCGGESPISEYPLGLGYLKSNYHTPGIFNIEIVKSRDELKDCDLIGLSSNAWGLSEAIHILDNTPSSIKVAIGGQGTLWDGLGDYSFDYIVRGEGEEAFEDIIAGSGKRFMGGKPMENIDNLEFPDRGKCGNQVPILTSRGCSFRCAFCSSFAHWGRARYHSPEYFMDEVNYLKKAYPKADTLYIMDDLFIANKNRFYEIHRLWMDAGMNKE